FDTLETRQLLSFSPTTSFPVGANPQAVVTADFNHDGKLDLATPGYDYELGDGSISVLLGNGNGSFQPAQTSWATGPYTSALAAGDFNADGKIDLAAANWGASSNDVSILLGNGDGTFADAIDVSIPAGDSWNIASGDLNADGKSDLVLTSYDDYSGGYLNVLLSNGDGSFATTTYGSYPHDGQLLAPTLADINGDGKIDVIVGAQISNTIKIFFGDGTGALQDSVNWPNGGMDSYGPDSIAVGDFNNDAVPDLVTTSS